MVKQSADTGIQTYPPVSSAKINSAYPGDNEYNQPV